MAITFAARGDSLTARYSSEGATPGLTNNADPQTVTSDVAGINGSTSVNALGAGSGSRAAIYNGRTNTPSGIARSMLLRVYVPSATVAGLFYMGSFTRNPINGCWLTLNGDFSIDGGVANDVGASDGSTVSAINVITAATWHDVVLTWDGTTGANGFVVYVDGTAVITDTMTRSLPSPFGSSDRLAVSQLSVGHSFTDVNCAFYWDEFVVWDTVIDPTSITLTSGSGSLNGASRTAYVDVAAYDGVAAAAAGGGGGPVLGGRGFNV